MAVLLLFPSTSFSCQFLFVSSYHYVSTTPMELSVGLLTVLFSQLKLDDPSSDYVRSLGSIVSGGF